MKLPYTTLLFAFFIACAALPAQTNPDSLWRLWSATVLHDTVRLNALNRLTEDLVKLNPDSARVLARMQLAFARETHSLPGQARALSNLGLACRLQSDYAQAIRYYEASIALLEKSGDRNFMATVYSKLGDVYRLRSNFPKAIDCITKSLTLAEETGDKKKAADAYIGIATIYYDDPGNTEKTVEYLNKALPLYETLDDPEGLALVFGNLSAVYLDRDSLDKALLFNEKCLTIQEERGDRYGTATSLHNRAIILGSLGRFREALADLDREISIFRVIGDQEGLADAYASLGDLLIDRKRFPEAIRMCDNALQIARKIGTPNLTEAEACQCLYTAYQAQGNYKQALHYLEEFMLAKDSLQQNETVQKLRQMELERQTVADSLNREKEKFRIEIGHQEALRRKDRTAAWITAAGLGVLAAGLAAWVRMLYFRRRAQRLQARSEALAKQQLLNEIALLRTQVNPHFLFNSLSILSSLVHVDPGLSEQFIAQMSRFYRYILEQKEQSLVTLRTELEFIESYSFLLKIRFENKFILDIQVPDALLDNKKIAPLTLQLLLENAVKHNRMSGKEPLVITVTVEAGDVLVVKNRLQPRATEPVSTGVGLQNILNRYALLSTRPVWAGETEGAFVVKVPLLG